MVHYSQRFKVCSFFIAAPNGDIAVDNKTWSKVSAVTSSAPVGDKPGWTVHSLVTDGSSTAPESHNPGHKCHTDERATLVHHSET